MNAEPVAMRRPVEDSPRPPSPPPPIVARSTSFVRFAKYALPIAAIGLAVLIFAWARINPVIERLQLSETELAPQEIESAAMENVRFAGVDAENRVFNVSAARAVQSVEDSNRIELTVPNADIALPDGTRIAVESEAGEFARNTRILDLRGSVVVTQNRGYEFRTSQAQIDLAKRIATGTAPVEGHGPDGDVTAEGFQILDDGARVIFTGRSHVMLRPQQEAPTP